jgi:hypothetical protein
MEKTWKPVTAGILSILAGVVAVLVGIGDLVKGELARRIVFHIGGEAVGFLLMIIGIVAIVGGSFAIGRRVWGWLWPVQFVPCSRSMLPSWGYWRSFLWLCLRANSTNPPLKQRVEHHRALRRKLKFKNKGVRSAVMTRQPIEFYIKPNYTMDNVVFSNINIRGGQTKE